MYSLPFMYNLIKEERVKQKKAQQDMASYCSVSRQTIHAIENQRLRPTVYLAILIARFLSKKVEEIFFVEEKK